MSRRKRPTKCQSIPSFSDQAIGQAATSAHNMKAPLSFFYVAGVSVLSLASLSKGYTVNRPTTPTKTTPPRTSRWVALTTMQMTGTDDAPVPTTFREAEVLGLRLMQEGNFKEALTGKLHFVSVTCVSLCNLHPRDSIFRPFFCSAIVKHSKRA